MKKNIEMIDRVLKDMAHGKSIRFKYAGDRYFFWTKNTGQIIITKNGFADSKVICNNPMDIEEILYNIINSHWTNYTVIKHGDKNELCA